MSRTLSAIALACLLLGCSKRDEGGQPNPPDKRGRGEPDLSKADVTISAEDYFKERSADEKGTAEKYKGKVVDVTGPVWFVEVNNAFKAIDMKIGMNASLGVPRVNSISISYPGTDKDNELRLLSRGQQVKLRATGEAWSGDMTYVKAKLVEVGPTTAKTVTLSELAKAMGDPAQKLKYADVDVVLQVKVAEHAKNINYTWLVTDPEMPSSPKFKLLSPSSITIFYQEIEALKPGDVVTIMAVPEDHGGPALSNPRIVSEPPTGVKLPDAKK